MKSIQTVLFFCIATLESRPASQLVKQEKLKNESIILKKAIRDGVAEAYSEEDIAPLINLIEPHALEALKSAIYNPKNDFDSALYTQKNTMQLSDLITAYIIGSKTIKKLLRTKTQALYDNAFGKIILDLYDIIDREASKYQTKANLAIKSDKKKSKLIYGNLLLKEYLLNNKSFNSFTINELLPNKFSVKGKPESNSAPDSISKKIPSKLTIKIIKPKEFDDKVHSNIPADMKDKLRKQAEKAKPIVEEYEAIDEDIEKDPPIYITSANTEEFLYYLILNQHIVGHDQEFAYIKQLLPFYNSSVFNKLIMDEAIPEVIRTHDSEDSFSKPINSTLHSDQSENIVKPEQEPPAQMEKAPAIHENNFLKSNINSESVSSNSSSNSGGGGNRKRIKKNRSKKKPRKKSKRKISKKKKKK